MSAGETASAWTLKPHPYELQSAVTGDHVVVFSDRERDGLQMEVSGETEHDELDIDWTNIELDPEDVEEILDGETYVERCEDLAGKPYEIHVRGGERHPKGNPVHTTGGEA